MSKIPRLRLPVRPVTSEQHQAADTGAFVLLEKVAQSLSAADHAGNMGCDIDTGIPGQSEHGLVCGRETGTAGPEGHRKVLGLKPYQSMPGGIQ